MEYIEESAKYLKKKDSSKSKANAKSKHKHNYLDCLLEESDGSLYKSTYCSECGKLKGIKIFEFGEGHTVTLHGLTKEDVESKYPDTPVIKVRSIWQKYIDSDSFKGVK